MVPLCPGNGMLCAAKRKVALTFGGASSAQAGANLNAPATLPPGDDVKRADVFNRFSGFGVAGEAQGDMHLIRRAMDYAGLVQRRVPPAALGEPVPIPKATEMLGGLDDLYAPFDNAHEGKVEPARVARRIARVGRRD